MYELNVLYDYFDALGKIRDPQVISLLSDMVRNAFPYEKDHDFFSLEEKFALKAAETLIIIDEVQGLQLIQQVIDDSELGHISHLEDFLSNWEKQNEKELKGDSV